MSQVNGNVGDVFYCWEKGDEGWYRIDAPYHASPISESEVLKLNVDPKDPPTLDQYWLYTRAPNGASGNADLTAFSKWLSANGKYITEADLKELAEKGTFKGKPVNDALVVETAKALHKDDNALFKKIDTSGGKGDGVIAPWDIDAALKGGKTGNNGTVGANFSHFYQWLSANGKYITEAELKELAEKGTFKGKPVNDPLVVETAKKLHADDNYLFRRIDSRVKGTGSGDGVIAPWDISPGTPPPVKMFVQ